MAERATYMVASCEEGMRLRDGKRTNISWWGLIRVTDDGLEVAEHLALGNQREVVFVQNVEPVFLPTKTVSPVSEKDPKKRLTELASSKNDDVAGI